MSGTMARDIGMIWAFALAGRDVDGKCGRFLDGVVEDDDRGRRGVWRVGGTDPEGLEAVPQAGQGGVGVAVVGAAADAVEGPAEPFEDGLPIPVSFPPVGAVVGISVEFDGQPLVAALDDKVDAEATDPMLDLDAVAASDEVAT